MAANGSSKTLLQQFQNVMARAEASSAASDRAAGVSSGAAPPAAPKPLPQQILDLFIRAGMSADAARASEKEIKNTGFYEKAKGKGEIAAMKEVLEAALNETFDGKTKYGELTPDELSEFIDGGHMFDDTVTEKAKKIRTLQTGLAGLIALQGTGGARRRKQSRGATQKRKSRRGSKGRKAQKAQKARKTRGRR